MMGCYLIAFALMMALVSRDPVKHRSLLLVAMALIALRLGQRLYFADKVMDVFRVPESRYWMSCGFVLLLLLALAAFWRQLGRDASATAAA